MTETTNTRVSRAEEPEQGAGSRPLTRLSLREQIEKLERLSFREYWRHDGHCSSGLYAAADGDLVKLSDVLALLPVDERVRRAEGTEQGSGSHPLTQTK